MYHIFDDINPYIVHKATELQADKSKRTENSEKSDMSNNIYTKLLNEPIHNHIVPQQAWRLSLTIYSFTLI